MDFGLQDDNMGSKRDSSEGNLRRPKRFVEITADTTPLDVEPHPNDINSLDSYVSGQYSMYSGVQKPVQKHRHEKKKYKGYNKAENDVLEEEVLNLYDDYDDDDVIDDDDDDLLKLDYDEDDLTEQEAKQFRYNTQIYSLESYSLWTKVQLMVELSYKAQIATHIFLYILFGIPCIDSYSLV